MHAALRPIQIAALRDTATLLARLGTPAANRAADAHNAAANLYECGDDAAAAIAHEAAHRSYHALSSAELRRLSVAQYGLGASRLVDQRNPCVDYAGIAAARAAR